MCILCVCYGGEYLRPATAGATVLGGSDWREPSVHLLLQLPTTPQRPAISVISERCHCHAVADEEEDGDDDDGDDGAEASMPLAATHSSKVMIKKATNDVYAAVIDDKIAMKIGSGDWSPRSNGIKLSGNDPKIACSGPNFAVWESV